MHILCLYFPSFDFLQCAVLPCSDVMVKQESEGLPGWVF